MQITRDYVYAGEIGETIEQMFETMTRAAEAHPSCRILENTPLDDGGHRFATEVRIGDIPEQAGKLLGSDTFSWRETCVWNPEKKEWIFETFNRFSPKYYRCHGRISCTEQAADRTKIHYAVSLEIHLPLLGKSLEKIIAERMKSNWDAQHGRAIKTL